MIRLLRRFRSSNTVTITSEAVEGIGNISHARNWKSRKASVECRMGICFYGLPEHRCFRVCFVLNPHKEDSSMVECEMVSPCEEAGEIKEEHEKSRQVAAQGLLIFEISVSLS